jgi:hypothetical protein
VQPITVGETATRTQPTATQPAAGALPSGWRWESFDRVEVGVPGDWGYGTSERPWCLKQKSEKPFVGRPGAVPAIGCQTEDAGGRDPGTILDTGGVFVWLSPMREGDTQAGTLAPPVSSGDRVSFVLNGVQVAIQAAAPLRGQILATVRAGQTKDHNDCPIASPFVGNPHWVPDGPPVTGLTGVKTVSACMYAGGRLTSSLRLSGPPASSAIAAVAAAPVGGGPNLPKDQCAEDDPPNQDMIVLQVTATQGASKILLRFGGCFHRGLYDGTTVRTLTRPAVAPFVTGPNEVKSFNGDALRPILRG